MQECEQRITKRSPLSIDWSIASGFLSVDHFLVANRFWVHAGNHDLIRNPHLNQEWWLTGQYQATLADWIQQINQQLKRRSWSKILPLNRASRINKDLAKYQSRNALVTLHNIGNERAHDNVILEVDISGEWHIWRGESCPQARGDRQAEGKEAKIRGIDHVALIVSPKATRIAHNQQINGA